MKKTDEPYISILGIFEIIVLALGVIISISATIKPLKYTNKYAWCFVFAVIGLVFIIVLAKNLKKRYAWLLGACLIFVYIFVAGFGAIVCEVNASRLRQLSYYEGKNVYTYVNDVRYEWDGESVTYDPSGFVPLREPLEFRVGDESKTFEETPPDLTEQYLADGKFLTMMPYYEMSDGTWKTDKHVYKYRLEITGRMNNAAKDSTFIYLSNIEDISFDQAWKAAGLSSNMDDYFDEKDAVLVAIK